VNEDSIDPISSRDCQSRHTATQCANIHTIYLPDFSCSSLIHGMSSPRSL